MRRLSDHPAEQREFGYRRPPPHNGLPAANETVSAISDRFVSEYAALDPTNAVRALGIGKDSTGLTDHSPAGTDESARSAVLTPRSKQISTMLARARERGEKTPSTSEVLDHLLAPLYVRALFGSPANEAFAETLVERLLAR